MFTLVLVFLLGVLCGRLWDRFSLIRIFRDDAVETVPLTHDRRQFLLATQRQQTGRSGEWSDDDAA